MNISLDAIRNQVSNLSVYDAKKAFRMAQNGMIQSVYNMYRYIETDMRPSCHELHRVGIKSTRSNK